MVTKYTQQFLRQVNWEGLDYLILDLPPGTYLIEARGLGYLVQTRTVTLTGSPGGEIIEFAVVLHRQRTVEILLHLVVDPLDLPFRPGPDRLATRVAHVYDQRVAGF